MTDAPFGEANPAGNYAELKKKAATCGGRDVAQPSEIDLQDFMTAAWRLAFLPMMTWSIMVSSGLSVLERAKPFGRLT